MTLKAQANNAPPGVVNAALNEEMGYVQAEMDRLGMAGIGFNNNDPPGNGNQGERPANIPARGVPAVIGGLEPDQEDNDKFVDVVLDDIKLRGTDRQSKRDPRLLQMATTFFVSHSSIIVTSPSSRCLSSVNESRIAGCCFVAA